MRRIRAIVIACLFTLPVAADANGAIDPDALFVTAQDVELKQFQWKKRPVVVFADSADDPAFTEQMELLLSRTEELEMRDVVVITDTDPDARSEFRMKLRPRGFMLAILGKDGELGLRKPFPWHVREITRSIDKMPDRQREIREMKDRASGR
ncbi:DUF4174 domain-containing protein [Sulfitobacter sp. LCG007]